MSDTVRERAIDAGRAARAKHRLCRCEGCEVTAIHDAMEPIIRADERRKTALEIADAIELDAATWHNNEAISAHDHKVLRAAARRVREIGATA